MGISLGLPINEDAIEKYHALMEDVWGQRLLSEQLWGATKAFLQSELAYRKAEFARETRFEDSYYALSEAYFNETGVRHLSAAGSLLEAYTRSSLFLGLADLDRAVYKEALESAQSFFLSGVKESGIPAEDVGSVGIEYGNQIEIFIREGYHGLISNVMRNVEKLMKARLTSVRGREKASPLPVWKPILIAVLLGTNVGAVVACFKTKQCTALAALAGGIPGWVAILLILGC